MSEEVGDTGGDDAVRLAELDDRQRTLQDRARQAGLERQRDDALEIRALAGLAQVAIERHGMHGGDLTLHQRSVAAELAVASRVSDTTVQQRMIRAEQLVHDWPAWLDAYESGSIGAGHLRALERAGEPIRCTAQVTTDQRDAYALAMLELAAEMPPMRLAKRAKVEADRLLHEPLTIRHQAARADRSVWITDDEDGMSSLGLRLPSVQAHGIHDRLLRIAKHKTCDDERTIPNVMADTAAEMLLTAPGTLTVPGSEHITAEVRVMIPARSLVETGYDESADAVEPALLDGSTPLDVESARELAGQQPTWMRLFVQPFTGYPVGVDVYAPTKAQRRWVQLRDSTCRFPSCDRPAWQCDTDHTTAHCDGGCTDVTNLAQLCRRHHMLKHHLPQSSHAWQVQQLAPGVLEWTTPLGEVYVDRPMPVGPRARRPTLRPVGPPIESQHGPPRAVEPEPPPF